MGVGYTTGAPVAVVAEPLDSSDQVSCLEVGVPAVQLFTGPHEDYHRPTDTADLIDAGGMAVVAEAVVVVTVVVSVVIEVAAVVVADMDATDVQAVAVAVVDVTAVMVDKVVETNTTCLFSVHLFRCTAFFNINQT